MSTFVDVEEAVAAARQAIRFDQGVDPEVAVVLVEVVERAIQVVSAVDDYDHRQRAIAAHILGEDQ
jgi:hypothetical protein